MDKPVEEFYKTGKTKGSLFARCKSCCKAADDVKRKSPERQLRYRSYGLRSLYKITHEEYESMLAAQGGCCAVCGRSEGGSVKGRFHVDHDHATGTVRGLLCHHCNVGIGHFKDNPILLRAASDYLATAAQ